uniref:Uncharacterized protein n=1 Tax=Aegilops tauschii TaxID=37682 RepID=M8C2A8_AEGTA
METTVVLLLCDCDRKSGEDGLRWQTAIVGEGWHGSEGGAALAPCDSSRATVIRKTMPRCPGSRRVALCGNAKQGLHSEPQLGGALDSTPPTGETAEDTLTPKSRRQMGFTSYAFYRLGPSKTAILSVLVLHILGLLMNVTMMHEKSIGFTILIELEGYSFIYDSVQLSC